MKLDTRKLGANEIWLLYEAERFERCGDLPLGAKMDGQLQGERLRDGQLCLFSPRNPAAWSDEKGMLSSVLYFYGIADFAKPPQRIYGISVQFKGETYETYAFGCELTPIE